MNSHRWGIRLLAEVNQARLYGAVGRLGAYVAMNDPEAVSYLVHDVDATLQAGTWRWGGAHPRLRFFVETARDWKLSVKFSLAEAHFKETGPVTISFFVNGQLLDKVRYDQPGDKEFEKPVPETFLKPQQENLVGIESDKIWTSSQDGARLSVILRSAGFIQ
jgi:hypothetical protein